MEQSEWGWSFEKFKSESNSNKKVLHEQDFLKLIFKLKNFYPLHMMQLPSSSNVQLAPSL